MVLAFAFLCESSWTVSTSDMFSNAWLLGRFSRDNNDFCNFNGLFLRSDFIFSSCRKSSLNLCLKSVDKGLVGGMLLREFLWLLCFDKLSLKLSVIALL